MPCSRSTGRVGFPPAHSSYSEVWCLKQGGLNIVYPVSVLLQVSGHIPVEMSLSFLSLGFLKSPELEFSVSKPPKVQWVCPGRQAGHWHMNWGSSGMCKACCTSVRVHAERSLHKVMFKKDFETLWCELLSKSRTLGCNRATAHHCGTIGAAITDCSEKFLKNELF